MRTTRAIEPLPVDLVHKLRAAASAASPTEARTWLPGPGRTTRLLQLVVRAIRWQSLGWSLRA